jgi:hypothetical protein
MIDKQDFMLGMRRLNEVLNLADEVQPVIMKRCMEAAEDFDSMDPVQFVVLWKDIKKMLTPINDKLLELQTVSMFRELQPPEYPDPEEVL